MKINSFRGELTDISAEKEATESSQMNFSTNCISKLRARRLDTFVDARNCAQNYSMFLLDFMLNMYGC